MSPTAIPGNLLLKNGMVITGEQKNNWTPAAITTALWLDAADASTITESGGAVSQWDDKSGNSRSLTQATPANQPSYSLGGLNGLNALSFDGAASFIDNAAIGLPIGGSARSMFVVYKPLRTTSTNTLAGQGSVSLLVASWFALQFRSPLGDPYFAGYASDIGGGPATITTTPKIAEIVYNGTTGTLFGTGNQYNTETRALNTLGNSFVVGRNSSGTEYGNALIGEIVFLSFAATTDVRQKLEGYLAHKWGLTANLPADHPYKTAIPVP
jgi:hypothetical protein